ncbi:MAG: NAD(P)H-hydrate dehydratase [Firmicutes bacterium]|nr:NAD(P)H-hydrate dehydratase [Bacillota bacterium]
MKVLTAAQMREVDRRTTEQFGVPSLTLMENAGRHVAEFAAATFPRLAGQRITVLCGKGNNGGDGFVAARLLAERGCRVRVLLFADPDSVQGDAAITLRRWREQGGELSVIRSAAEWARARALVAESDLVVDALLGTGLAGPVEGLLRTVIEEVNRGRERYTVLAVDIPSGLPADGSLEETVAIEADYTVTFTAPKLGQLLWPGTRYVGELVVVQIGTPRELLDNDPALNLHYLEPGEFRSLPLRRRRDTHKGDYGHVLIFAGSRGKTGAAVLAARGALRAGAGLVTVATPAPVLPIVAAGQAELMTEPMAATDAETIAASNVDYGRLQQLLETKTVVALGPGLGTHLETQQFVRTVTAECALPLILDADGLNAFVGRADELRQRRAPLALTPHPGEMARLLGCTTREVRSRRLELAQQAAARWNACVVLKGYRTILATPDGRVFFNSTGNPGMATGGTGDVLTGVLAALTAQFGTADWARVLALGVYLHGLAGDLAAARTGETSLLASDLVDALPAAFARLQEELRAARV